MLVCALSLSLVSCGGDGLLPSSSDKTASSGGRAAPHFEPGFNLFGTDYDVKIGRESAQQMASQLPLMRDEQVVAYVRELGGRLAAQAPGEKFPYQFNVVATREMNAFALPGGFIFINAGAIISARNEGELAGVIAHEIMHVALRHGTNQASKAYIAKAGLGILGTLAGSGDTPELGQVINAVGGAGANMLFLKFGRTAEKQADLEGAELLAKAGYDPRDMASFFETLQKQGGQRTPEFLSDHPDPGNRVRSILETLPNLPVSANPRRTSPAFEQIKARLTGSRAGGMSADVNLNRTGPRDPNDIEAGTRPALPAASFGSFQAPDKSYALEVPSNWTAASRDGGNIILAPQNGFGEREQSVFVTHGAFVGTLRAQTSDLATATRQLVEQQLSANPDFQVTRSGERVTIGGRQGLATVVTGPSTVSSVREVDVIFTALTADGRLFYLIAVAPENELQSYQAAFERMVGSVRLAG